MKVIIEKTTDNFYTKLEVPAHFTLGQIADLWGWLNSDDFGAEGLGHAARTKPLRPILSGSAARGIPIEVFSEMVKQRCAEHFN